MAKKKVLLVHARRNREKCEREHRRFEKAAGDSATFSCISVIDENVNWDNPAKMLEGIDAVVMGGSSDFFFHGGRDENAPERAGTFEMLQRVKPFVEYIIENKIPLLGVCLGHQIVAELFGGKVTHDQSQRKMGTYDVVLTEEGKNDPLFSQLPESFAAQYAHRDAVTVLPDGATLVGSSPTCRFAVLRYGTSVYTMQFHPELVAQDLLDNAEAVSEYLPSGMTIIEVVRESPAPSRLIPSFIQSIA